MCIIAIKGYGVEYPTVDRVSTMCRNNPDGFALAYFAKGEGVRIYRTMHKDTFIKEYEKVKDSHNKDDIALFIHARISTNGSTNINNCHGWKDDDIGMCFAHNGILRIDNRDDLTDSETFFRDIFVPAFSIGGWVAGEKTIRAIIGTSKFVFLDALGAIHYYGEYIQDADGCLYSNSTYKDYGYAGCCSRWPSKWNNSYGNSWGGASKKENGSGNAGNEYDYPSYWGDDYYWNDSEYYGH